jgi:predicted dehydrogenase
LERFTEGACFAFFSGTEVEMSQLRVAVIGCGGRSRSSHLPFLRDAEDAELVAVCDPVPAARDRAGEEFGVGRRCGSVEELLDAECLDAVFVAVPPHLNAEAALPCLERGVHTLLEKPPGMNVAETLALRDAAARTEAKAMVGWNRRFHPLIAQARERVEARGPVTQIVGEFHKGIAAYEGRGLAEIVMDNHLLESPIHAVDLVRALAGPVSGGPVPIVELHSVVRRACSRYKDVFAALVLFANGCVAQLTANYTTNARLERYEIHGNGISAYLEGVLQAVLLCDGQRHELGSTGSNGTREQDRYFLDCVRDDRPIALPAADLDEAVKTMELAEAILAGLRSA